MRVSKNLNVSKYLEGDTSPVAYLEPSILTRRVQCHFSPEFSTGQHYIYTGYEAAGVIIFDVLTGKTCSILKGTRSYLHNISWHPDRKPLIIMVLRTTEMGLLWHARYSGIETSDSRLRFQSLVS